MSALASAPNTDPPPRVLLVDDDASWRARVVQALSDRGFRVTECGRAEAALDALAMERPDCVVTAVRMAGLDGHALCRRIRALTAGAGLPVLMLTSLDEDEATRQACEGSAGGTTDYSTKSNDWTQLSHRIRMLLKMGALERDARGGGAPRVALAAPSGAFDWRPVPRRLRASPELLRILEWPDTAPLPNDRRLLAMTGPADRRWLRHAFARLLTGGPAVRREIDATTPTGRHRRLRVEVLRVATGADGTTELSGTVHDVTPVEGDHAHVHRFAHYDALTGLPNRAWLLDRLQRDADRPGARTPRGGVAILAIDRFRQVSDALGAAAGDRLLVEAAQRLRRLTGAPGVQPTAQDAAGRVTAVVHLDAEEFGLLIDGLADRDAAVAIGRRAVETLREPFHAGGREVFLRASVGVYADVGADAGPGQDRSAWLARADRARRAASGLGGNCALAFEATMAESGSDRLEMERDLHYALQRGEMAMHFQPQFAASTGRLVGFEALMRWTRQGTMQPAGTFIPLAEETGLIVPLGEWAIDEACSALAAMRALGLVDCVMSVNLSAQQLRTGRLPAVVAAALAAHDVPAEQLEVELTESGMMQDPEVAVAELRAVRALGAGLAVDDFGTGYSSLAYLTRLPLTTLKIDRSFVQDVQGSERSLAVARTIVALGENLQLRVVAEGVETEAQRHALMDLGCDLQQGYLYGRAVPLEDALRLATLSPGVGIRAPMEMHT